MDNHRNTYLGNLLFAAISGTSLTEINRTDIRDEVGSIFDAEGETDETTDSDE